MKQKNLASTKSNDQALIFQSPQMQAILKLKHKHEKNVEQTVQVIEDLSFNKMPQKCFQHNNNYTLYCENDQKPICASCMYQNQIHKLHKVLPLNSCEDQLKRDCQKLEKQLGFIVDNMTGLVKHVNDGISRLDKEFPHLVWKIQEEYKKLHNFLVDREKEHVNQLRYHKQKMKYQHGALSTQLSKISLYIQDKIDQYSRKNDFDILVTKRCVFDSLKSSAKIVSQQLNLKQQSEPKLHFQVFKQIEDFMYAKLPRLFIKQSAKKPEKLLYHNASSKNALHSSKSKQKSSFSPVSIAKKQSETKIQQKKQQQQQSKSPSRQKLFRDNQSKQKNKMTTKKQRTPTRSQKATTPIKTPQRQRSKSNQKPILKNSSNKSKSPLARQQTSPHKFQSPHRK